MGDDEQPRDRSGAGAGASAEAAQPWLQREALGNICLIVVGVVKSLSGFKAFNEMFVGNRTREL